MASAGSWAPTDEHREPKVRLMRWAFASSHQQNPKKWFSAEMAPMKLAKECKRYILASVGC